MPCISLRTRRSLRAVHFHPHGAPLLLSAEVNETSEHDVPPLRAMTTPHRAGERETAYAAALSAAVAATAEQRAAATPDGGGGRGAADDVRRPARVHPRRRRRDVRRDGFGRRGG